MAQNKSENLVDLWRSRLRGAAPEAYAAWSAIVKLRGWDDETYLLGLELLLALLDEDSSDGLDNVPVTLALQRLEARERKRLLDLPTLHTLQKRQQKQESADPAGASELEQLRRALAAELHRRSGLLYKHLYAADTVEELDVLELALEGALPSREQGRE